MTRRCSHGSEWLLAMLGVLAGAACSGGRPNVGLDETPPELAFASEVPEAVSLTLAPVTQARDDAGNVYGVANERASIAINGSFTH